MPLVPEAPTSLANELSRPITDVKNICTQIFGEQRNQDSGYLKLQSARGLREPSLSVHVQKLKVTFRKRAEYLQKKKAGEDAAGRGKKNWEKSHISIHTMAQNIGLNIGGTFFLYDNSLSHIFLRQEEKEVRLDCSVFIALVEIFIKFLKDPQNKKKRQKCEMLDNVLVSYDFNCLRFETQDGNLIGLTAKNVSTFLKHIGDREQVTILFTELPNKSRIFLHNFVALMTELRDDARISHISDIFSTYDSFSEEIIATVLQSCDLDDNKCLIIEAFHFLSENLPRALLLVFACRFASNPLEIEI